MQEFYSKRLIELKPYLGKNYLAQIKKELSINSKSTIRNAFEGKCGDLELVKRIYTKALEISKSNKAAAELAIRENEKLLANELSVN